jgi:hypothetical protein
MSNSFNCDCNLKWIKSWMKQSNLAIGNPKCALPANMKDRSLANLNDEDFLCNEFSVDSTNECGFSTTRLLKQSVTVPQSNSCPQNCTCSSNTVRCSHLGLKQIPSDIPLDVKELYAFS